MKTGAVPTYNMCHDMIGAGTVHWCGKFSPGILLWEYHTYMCHTGDPYIAEACTHGSYMDLCQ